MRRRCLQIALAFSFCRQGLVIKVQFSDDLLSWSAAQVLEGSTPSESLTVTEGAPAEELRWIHVTPESALGNPGSTDLRVLRWSKSFKI